MMWNVLATQPARTLVLAVALVAAAGASMASAAPQPPGAHALLDVPYVSQTPDLCGGAAVAMVLRYWGERDVYAQDFVPFLGAGVGGIVTGTLATAVRNRGWQAIVLPTSDGEARTTVRVAIDQGRPLIALIEVAPLTYHYVVVVGSTDQDVVVHDPARAPFRVLRWAEFDRAWAAAHRWVLLVLPPDGTRRADSVGPAASSSPAVVALAAETPCGTLVERSVQMALTGDGAGAEQGLVAATALCPNEAASWRELAGVRFTQSRWAESLTLALVAVSLAPSDVYAWQLVATSRYLTGDVSGALAAWNRLGEPLIDTIDIHGTIRTRQSIVVRAAGLQPRQILTPEAFRRALRRLRDMPVASDVSMTFEPLDDGLAKVDVALAERKMLPTGWMAYATLGVKALLRREVRVDVAGPTGGGELASATWRWAAGRPRVAFGLALPSPQWLPGIVSIDGSWERQSYAVMPSADSTAPLREERRRAGLQFADWSSSWLRWQAGAAVDRMREHSDRAWTNALARDYVALDTAFDVRLAGDRLALVMSGGWWAPVGGGRRFSTAELRATWRSTNDATRPVWSVVTDYAVANRGAPLALWQGAGTGQGRGALLRAHPLLDNGVVTGPVFGREVVSGSVEVARPVVRTRMGSLSIAGFVDGAQAWHRLNGSQPSPFFVDAGFGVRAQVPRLGGGGIRIDVARGLRGGGTTLSASWGGSGRR